MNKEEIIYCLFCGASVGDISESTDQPVTAIYDCPKCQVNYCSECSYAEEIDGEYKQFCLRCDSQIYKICPI